MTVVTGPPPPARGRGLAPEPGMLVGMCPVCRRTKIVVRAVMCDHATKGSPSPHDNGMCPSPVNTVLAVRAHGCGSRIPARHIQSLADALAARRPTR